MLVIFRRLKSPPSINEMMCRVCLSDTCQGQNVPGTLQQLLIVCPALEQARQRLHHLLCLETLTCPPFHRLILQILSSSPEIQTRFILDSTAFPEIIVLVQTYGRDIQDSVLCLTKRLAFSLHKQKLKLLGRWPGSTDSQTRQEHTPVINTAEKIEIKLLSIREALKKNS